MAKKPTYIPPTPTAELKTTRDDARSKLADRIEKGLSIKATSITSASDLDATRRLSDKWDDFNIQLLKTLFTTDQYSDEYSSNNNYFAMSFHEKSLGEKINDFYRSIDNKTHCIESIIERLELINISHEAIQSSTTQKALIDIDRKKIFIVHGHDNQAKLEVARFIEKIGYEPIILHEQASGSQTIIEKIESYSNVGFGIILYTPCDVGASKADESNLKNRARQNVVFEHGFLIGKLSRQNVCALIKGDIETPNDISGIVYTVMNDEGWKLTVAKELKKAGYVIDMNKVIE